MNNSKMELTQDLLSKSLETSQENKINTQIIITNTS